jgi:hypothetical protein
MLRITLLIIVCTPFTSFPATRGFTSCLPDGVTLKSEVVDNLWPVELSDAPQNTRTKQKRTARTVKSILTEFGAQCKNGRLTNRKGKEIRIVQLIGCWGNPPEDYEEQINRQRREIEELRKKSIVIEIPCTASKTIARTMSDML